jgi:hypothetical protein
LDELTYTVVFPFPERATLALFALDEIEIDADFASPVCGEKTISNVQLLVAGTDWPEQLSIGIENSEAFVPVSVMEYISRAAVPELVSVIDRAVDEAPTVTLPKDTVAGDNDMPGTGTSDPVPLNVINVGVTGSLDGMEMLAVFEPWGDCGENFTVNVQFPDTAMGCPEHESVGIENSAALVPVRVIVPMIRPSSPGLLIVIVCAVDEVSVVMLPKFMLDWSADAWGAGTRS